MGSKKILVIHPEGNIYNNPNLYEILKLLSANYQVDVLLPELSINLGKSGLDINLVQYPRFYRNILRKASEISEMLLNVLLYGLKRICIHLKYDLVIGVDQLGIIIAQSIASESQTNFALISYEIFFTNESSILAKKIEQKACQDVRFVVIQDEIRARLLSKENNIDIERFVYLPVSSRHTKPYKRQLLLHEKLAIPKNKKILLFVGSVAEWSGVKFILSCIDWFPDDWVVVFHDRYQNTLAKVLNISPQFDKDNYAGKVYFSDYAVVDTTGMYELIHSADLGCALYFPDFKSKYTGKNIEYIGLSSGKICTYLQNGLPVVTTPNISLQKGLKNRNTIYFVENKEEFLEVLQSFQPSQSINDDCIEYFNKNLSFEKFRNDFIEKVVQFSSL